MTRAELPTLPDAREHPGDWGRGDWMQTASGRAFYPADPRHEDITISDVAHALSHLCRFAGHVRDFYCVAHHSVLVSQIVRPELALVGLLHDAAEAYLVDVPRPVKALLPGYKELERRVERVIGERFGVELVDLHPDVKHADLVALATERRDLMPPAPKRWDSIERIAPAPERIVPWTPVEARDVLLERFLELGGWHRTVRT